MKVAFATKDGININDHFGWAKQFAIYEVNQEGYSLTEIVKSEEDHTEEDNKINSKVEAIEGVSILYCEAIGPTAAARVVKARIHPIKISQPQSIEEACEQLVKMIGANPPPWIKRILAREGGENA